MKALGGKQIGLEAALSGDKADVVHVHLRQTQWLWAAIKAFALGHRTVIPMRDPLLSVIKGLHIGDIYPQRRVQAFEDVVKLDRLTDVEFVPVDLPGKRVNWIKEWGPENSAGNYPLKQAYCRGDTSDITSDISGVWDFLCKREDKLRPLLERIGYRDLLWWS